MSDIASLPGRIGFCCQLVLDDPAEQTRVSMRTTTLAWLARQTPAAAYDRLAEIAAHNLDALEAQIGWVGALPREERMFRIVSGMFPGWSHPAVEHYWQDADLNALVERRLAEIGALTRTRDVRLAMHPGQYAVIATLRAEAYANAVRDIMEHVRQFALMGYAGDHPHGAFINVHGGGAAAGVEGLRAGLDALPSEARAMLTLENDELSFGLDDLLQVADRVAIVVDFHHHWVHSRGEYLEPDDPRVDQIIASWRGIRPAAHISVSQETLLGDHDPETRPAFAQLGHAPAKLRAHSEMMWNRAVNRLVARHLSWCDVEVEAKAKNRASRQLADQLRSEAAA